MASTRTQCLNCGENDDDNLKFSGTRTSVLGAVRVENVRSSDGCAPLVAKDVLQVLFVHNLRVNSVYFKPPPPVGPKTVPDIKLIDTTRPRNSQC